MVKCIIETEPVFPSSFFENPKDGLMAPCKKDEIVTHEVELSSDDYAALEELFNSRRQHRIHELAPHLYAAINPELSYDKESEDAHDYIITKVSRLQ